MFKVSSVITVLLCLCVVVTISGCCKHSIWRKGDIQAEGQLITLSGKRSYDRLYVGSPDSFAKELPPLYFEWPTGEKILLRDLTADTLLKMDTVREPAYCFSTTPSALGEPVVRDWPGETRVLSVHCPSAGYGDFAYVYSFAILNNRIIGFIAYEGCKPLGFWNQTLTKRYEFPVTDKELVEIFGEPDKVVEFFAE